MKNNKSIVILSTLLFCLVSVFSQGESSLVYPGDDGKLIYTMHANTMESNKVNRIPDFSNCGYMGGGVKIPEVAVKITLYPKFGDDRKRIQDAIDYVSSLEPDANGFRGAVLLKAGTYIVHDGMVGHGDALQINTSGVVLRGEGQGEDGSIIVSPFEAKHQIIATRPENPKKSTSNQTMIVDSYVGSGAKGFHVEDASAYAVGDIIFVRFTPNQTWLSEIYANAYMSDGDVDWTTSEYTISYERRITDINGDSISIHSPVIVPMQTKFGGGVIQKVTFPEGPRLHNVGVENLRLVGAGVTTSCPADDPNRLKTGIQFNYTENSWIRGITIVRTSNSLFVSWDSHYNTFQDCASIDPLGPKRAGYRYTFYIDAASSHNLCQRLYTDDGRHDFVLGPRIPGPNVFLDGFSSRGGTLGPHQRWATGTLFDNIKSQSLLALEHRGTSGSGHSWAGIQSVIWNTESPTIVCDAPVGHLNYAIGNISNEVLSGYIDNTMPGSYRGKYDHHGSHVATRSLYLKQLQDRVGDAAVENITIPEQRTGSIYELLEDWKGAGALTEVNTVRLNAPGNLRMVDSDYSIDAKYVMLQWEDKADNENGYVLERSADGGENYDLVIDLPAGSESYKDSNIAQSTVHYRLKAENNTHASGYIYLYVDLMDEMLSRNITFRVNTVELTDVYAGGAVWLIAGDENTKVEMNDEDGDGIYELTMSMRVDRNVTYHFAYQNGPDIAINMVEENVSASCGNSEGRRTILIPESDLTLEANLFGACEEALPSGIDITDHESIMIKGSNDDEAWIDGSTGAGSPPAERVDMLIDNDLNTKYLVRAEVSWIEIYTNYFTKLSGYTITSANDDPSRDPRSWILEGWDSEHNRWNNIHDVSDNPPWSERFKMKVWLIENENWYAKYRLYINSINGNSQSLMQMGELQLFGELGGLSSIDESKKLSVSIYPNPACEFLNIQFSKAASEDLQLQLFDISGKIIFEENFNGIHDLLTINTSFIESGLYFLKINSENTSYGRRILIQK